MHRRVVLCVGFGALPDNFSQQTHVKSLPNPQKRLGTRRWLQQPDARDPVQSDWHGPEVFEFAEKAYLRAGAQEIPNTHYFHQGTQNDTEERRLRDPQESRRYIKIKNKAKAALKF